ncbi:hypothetical protein [Actinomyces ruminis]|uniref:hypothetical protein n=1 Tax=Actinomyces ruminis TaxID=1937003 RepID=UPI001C558777|nr:hypothetical protein [Actinomyces ruminis]
MNPPAHRKISDGTALFDAHPHGVEAYLAQVNDPSKGDHERFEGVELPVHVRDNVYGNGAPAYTRETRPVHLGEVNVVIEDADGGGLELVIELSEAFAAAASTTIAGRDLGRAWYPDAAWENPDGTEAFADVDLVGRVKEHNAAYPAGPLAGLVPGVNRVRIW